MASRQDHSAACDCCDDLFTSESRLVRRDFLKTAGGVALGAGALAAGLPVGRVGAEAKAAADAATPSSPESLVKVLYDALSPKQREAICFPWNHQDPERGLLRTRVANNWDITDYFIVDDDFYTKDQQHIIRGIYEGIINPEWHARIDKQLDDDAGGYGEQNSIAIFGEPGSKQFEFVMTGRHMTIRCDGNTAPARGFRRADLLRPRRRRLQRRPDPPRQRLLAAGSSGEQALPDARQARSATQALVRRGLPEENRVGFRGKNGKFAGIAVSELSGDQKDHLRQVMAKLVEPYRQSDRDEAMQCLKTQGGLDACHLAYYAQDDIGKDGVWDIWRLEGPSFVWHYRGAPHVHVWVNVADDPSVKLNA